MATINGLFFHKDDWGKLSISLDDLVELMKMSPEKVKATVDAAMQIQDENERRRAEFCNRFGY